MERYVILKLGKQANLQHTLFLTSILGQLPSYEMVHILPFYAQYSVLLSLIPVDNPYQIKLPHQPPRPILPQTSHHSSPGGILGQLLEILGMEQNSHVFGLRGEAAR